MAHRFSVLLDCNLQILLCFHLNKGLATGATLAGVSEVNAATIVDNLAVCSEKISHEAVCALLNLLASVLLKENGQ